MSYIPTFVTPEHQEEYYTLRGSAMTEGQKKVLKSLGIDYETFGQKPWDESMLESTTEKQIDNLRHLIKQEIDAAQIDGMEHGAWGWADRQLEEGWQEFKDSFKEVNALNALRDLYANNDNGMKDLANN